jgi:hypothetical protein
MVKGWISRLLSLDETEELPPFAAREPLGQLRVPTLDERASLYLRAVHGTHDFGSEAHSGARNLILNAMAADIVLKSGIKLPLSEANLTQETIAAAVAAGPELPAFVVHCAPLPAPLPSLRANYDEDESDEAAFKRRVARMSGYHPAKTESPGPKGVPASLRVAGLVLQAVFTACLLVLTLRVTQTQNGVIWAAVDDKPSDLILRALGFAVCIGILILFFVFRVPADKLRYRTLLYYGLAVLFALISILLVR